MLTYFALPDDPILLGLKRAALKQQQKSKKRRGVDQRASKGRKIRYSVQEKIQNYMAPEPRGSWHSEMSEELFAALFGQHEEHHQEGADSKGDLKLGPRDDGFKIL